MISGRWLPPAEGWLDTSTSPSFQLSPAITLVNVNVINKGEFNYPNAEFANAQLLAWRPSALADEGRSLLIHRQAVIQVSSTREERKNKKRSKYPK